MFCRGVWAVDRPTCNRSPARRNVNLLTNVRRGKTLPQNGGRAPQPPPVKAKAEVLIELPVAALANAKLVSFSPSPRSLSVFSVLAGLQTDSSPEVIRYLSRVSI